MSEMHQRIPDRGKDALNDLADYFAPELRACNQEIVDRLESGVPLIEELGTYLVAAGGKRIRPLLLLAGAQMAAPDLKARKEMLLRAVRMGACVEFIHTATLLHDDVVDESLLRRGTPSANAVFGNQASVLVGDFLFARAFQLMTGEGSLEIMSVLSQASVTIAEGEVLQMAIQSNLETSMETYVEVLRRKTAALFAAACEVGGVIGGGASRQVRSLQDYGLNLGIAFQLADDALDYGADQDELGKTLGDDLREGKITYPLLTAYWEGTSQEKDFLEKFIAREQRDSVDWEKAFDLIKKYDGVQGSVRQAGIYGRKAIEALETFPPSPLRDLLSEVALYAGRRNS